MEKVGRKQIYVYGLGNYRKDAIKYNDPGCMDISIEIYFVEDSSHLLQLVT